MTARNALANIATNQALGAQAEPQAYRVRSNAGAAEPPAYSAGTNAGAAEPPAYSAGTNAAEATSGAVRRTLQLEGLLLLAAATAAYFHLGFSGVWFAALFLVPDISLVGYLRGPRVGAAIYNTAHSMIGPLALGMLALVGLPALLPCALIWLAHIGLDRALGYGLKYGAGFRHTHLGLIGRR